MPGAIRKEGLDTLPEGGTHILPKGKNKSRIIGGADKHGE